LKKGKSVVKKFESLGANVRAKDKAIFGDPNDIARTELKRFRRRLGTLTHDQELQIENLLISTVAQVSLVTRRVMEALVENSQTI
jgi:hypothetical protein